MEDLAAGSTQKTNEAIAKRVAHIDTGTPTARAEKRGAKTGSMEDTGTTMRITRAKRRGEKSEQETQAMDMTTGTSRVVMVDKMGTASMRVINSMGSTGSLVIRDGTKVVRLSRAAQLLDR